MTNAIEAQIKDRISAFVVELDALVRKSALEALSSVLAGGAAPAPRRVGRPAGSGGRRGRKPADLGDALEKVVGHVRANDGQGIAAIASATGLDLKVAKKAALQLLASGALKKSGRKRGTVYHAGSGTPARAAKRGKGRGRKRKAA
jgi:hypothetical protein